MWPAFGLHAAAGLLSEASCADAENLQMAAMLALLVALGCPSKVCAIITKGTAMFIYQVVGQMRSCARRIPGQTSTTCICAIFSLLAVTPFPDDGQATCWMRYDFPSWGVALCALVACEYRLVFNQETTCRTCHPRAKRCFG